MTNDFEIEKAERYAATLERIKELQEEVIFNDADIEKAETYLTTLERIKDLEGN